MVKFLYKYFYIDKNIYDKLSIISDGMCKNDGNNYIDFDQFSNYIKLQIATTDTLLINDNYIVFVEFKNLNKVEDFNVWFNKNRRQQIYLKAYESYLALEKLIIKNGFECSDYKALDKRFILVYDGNDPRRKIRNHIQGKIKRFAFIFNGNAFTINCEGLKKILGDKEFHVNI